MAVRANSFVTTIAAHGCVGNGTTDNRSALISALTDGLTQGNTLLVPAGVYRIDNGAGELAVSGLSGRLVFEPGAVFEFADVSTGGFQITSCNGLEIHGFRARWATTPTIRVTGADVLDCIDCQNLNVVDLRIENSPGMAMLLRNCKSAHLSRLRVSNTLADGIHVRDSGDVTVSDLIANNTGDDSLAFIRYDVAGEPPVTGTEYDGPCVATNIISTGSRARGIVVVGMSNVAVGNFLIRDSKAQGIIVGNDVFTQGHHPQKVTVSDGILHSCGEVSGVHAITVFEEEAGGVQASFSNIDIIDPLNNGVYVTEINAGTKWKDSQVEFNNVRVFNAGLFGFQLEYAKVHLSDCRVNGAPGYGFFFNDCPQVFWNNLEAEAVGNATYSNRALFHADCAIVLGQGLKVIDERGTPQGYKVGDSGSGWGRVYNVQYRIPSGSLTIETASANMLYQYDGGPVSVTGDLVVNPGKIVAGATAAGMAGQQVQVTGSLGLGIKSDAPIRLYDSGGTERVRMNFESGNFIWRYISGLLDMWWISFLSGGETISLFGGADNTSAARLWLQKGKIKVAGIEPTDPGGLRTDIDVYSKAEVDTLLAAKANTGTYTTSSASGHTHTVTI